MWYQGTSRWDDVVPDVQSVGRGGRVRAAHGPLPAGHRRAAADAAAGRGRARQLRGAADLVTACRLPRPRARDRPNQCGLLYVLQILPV